MASILTNILGIFVYLFILWKRLKEDFASEIIFKLGFSILAGTLVGLLVSYRFLPSYFFWFGLIGGAVGLTGTVFRFKTKFFEIFEAYVVAMFPWLGFVFLYDSVINYSLSSFLGFLAILILIFVSYYAGSHYKNISWYKSGKIGFAGLVTLGLTFAIRFILAILGVNVLSFVNKFEAIISGFGIIVCVLLLIYLAKTKE